MEKILITGASQGLGKTIAYQLAAAADHLILIARSENKLKKIQKELSAKTKVDILAVDLTEKGETARALADYADPDMAPTVLINNLGAFDMGKASALTLEELQQQLDINLFAAVSVSNCFLPAFKENKKGTIVNIGSLASHKAVKDAAAYSISKHALKGWNDALREEMRNYGVKVSALYPSSINTESWDGVEGVNRGKMVQTEDIAALISTMIKLNKASLVEEIHLSPLEDFTEK